MNATPLSQVIWIMLVKGVSGVVFWASCHDIGVAIARCQEDSVCFLGKYRSNPYVLGTIVLGGNKKDEAQGVLLGRYCR